MTPMRTKRGSLVRICFNGRMVCGEQLRGWPSVCLFRVTRIAKNGVRVAKLPGVVKSWVLVSP